MQIASCVSRGDQGTVQTPGCLADSLEGEEQCGSWTSEWYGSSGSTFQPKEFCLSEHNFWFTLPANPCLFRLTVGGNHETPEVLRRGRLPYLHPRQPGHRLSWEDPRQGLGSVPPSPSGQLTSSLLADRSCAPVSSAALRGSTPAMPWCSCWAGWVGPGDLHVKALLGSDDEPVCESLSWKRLSEPPPRVPPGPAEMIHSEP